MDTDFMPRGLCGPWTNELMTLYIAANALICLAYLTLAFQLCITVKVHSLFRSSRGLVKVMFACFIFACGVGHFLDGVLPFRWPNYYVFTAWHWITALLSVGTAVVFPRLVVQNILEDGKQKRGKK